MEHIINRVALEHDLPVSTVREEMVAAIHEAAESPTELFKAVFGDREPTPEELILYLAAALEDVELDSPEETETELQ